MDEPDHAIGHTMCILMTPTVKSVKGMNAKP